MGLYPLPTTSKQHTLMNIINDGLKYTHTVCMDTVHTECMGTVHTECMGTVHTEQSTVTVTNSKY